MLQILPIGSVVKVQNYKLCLLGARMVEWEGKYVLAYSAVKHPRGFAGKESMGLIPASAIEEVLYHGYEEQNGKKYREDLERLFSSMKDQSKEEILKMYSPENMKKYMEQLEQSILSGSR